MGVSIVTGCDGRVGSLLLSSLTRAVGIHGQSVYSQFEDAVIREMPHSVYHCAGNSSPEAEFDQHFATVRLAAHVLEVCSKHRVRTVYLCGSSWADPIVDGRTESHRTNAYGAAKRAVREMAMAYPGDAKYVRLGWYPASPVPDGAPDWLKKEYWTDEDVLAAFGLRQTPVECAQ